MLRTKAMTWVLSACLMAGGSVLLVGTGAAEGGGAVGINVVLRSAVTDAALADLGRYGAVLDVLPQINGVTLRSTESALPAIRALRCVADASLDAVVELAGTDALPVADLSGGANCWNLDAIDVTDFGGARTVAYDGAGVYVAVIDTGLPRNWRTYFPEERIATQLARAFTGGGGAAHVVSSQPEKWEHDWFGHGTTVTCAILGFAYSGPDARLPATFNGVAPKVTVIPIVFGGDNGSGRFESVMARCIVYAADLKAGALGGAPLVINLSNGIHRDVPLERAAIDYAIACGVVVVAAAGNEADVGMRYPAAYPEVISVAASAWTGQFPQDDPTNYHWILRDVPESDASPHFIAPFSSRELPGQELDVAAPGFPVPVAWTVNGLPDWTFVGGTSAAVPHVVGVAALMLQKNPGLTQAQVESILRSSARPLPPGTATARYPIRGPGEQGYGTTPTFAEQRHISFVSVTTSWGADATGAGLVDADAALTATPLP